MRSSLRVLNEIQIDLPCRETWSGMKGDHRVRHCHRCNQSVTDLSQLTDDEAAALITGSEGRICLRVWRRRDGSVVTRDGHRWTQRLLSSWQRVVGIASFFGFLGLSGCTPVLGGMAHIIAPPSTAPTTLPASMGGQLRPLSPRAPAQ
jgi:hypothetical protein